MTEEEFEKRNLENHKLTFEVFKHLTTLASGFVVALAIVLDKMFPAPACRWMVGVSVSCFLVSVLCSVAMMVKVSTTVEADDPGCASPVGIALVGSGGLFAAGVAALVLFVVFNL